ncbi:ABC transporter ATP-binding protein [alpha proteobacterium BAL199]|jgi:alpha-D-ribose 1-methylphosphonate 5-triphosphate synthase subunit PhnL|nr:ABC transporter ATP-binding protein [alpha proteobacterium BAL199]
MTSTLEADVMLRAERLAKSFVLHNQGGVTINVFDGLDLEVRRGECLILAGPSGAGKSSLLRSLYANYKPQSGSVLVRHEDRVVDLCAAEPYEVLEVRRRTLGYVSQFLRVIPRVPTIDLVTEPLTTRGVDPAEARERAGTLLTRLRIPEALWRLPPATFSGGEQQRVNIAMTFVQDYPILLLDEPTASLDVDNRRTVTDLITEAHEAGAAIVGIFHDAEVRAAVGTRSYDLSANRQAA